MSASLAYLSPPQWTIIRNSNALTHLIAGPLSSCSTIAYQLFGVNQLSDRPRFLVISCNFPPSPPINCYHLIEKAHSYIIDLNLVDLTDPTHSSFQQVISSPHLQSLTFDCGNCISLQNLYNINITKPYDLQVSGTFMRVRRSSRMLKYSSTLASMVETLSPNFLKLYDFKRPNTEWSSPDFSDEIYVQLAFHTVVLFALRYQIHRLNFLPLYWDNLVVSSSLTRSQDLSSNVKRNSSASPNKNLKQEDFINPSSIVPLLPSFLDTDNGKEKFNVNSSQNPKFSLQPIETLDLRLKPCGDKSVVEFSSSPSTDSQVKTHANFKPSQSNVTSSTLNTSSSPEPSRRLTFYESPHSLNHFSIDFKIPRNKIRPQDDFDGFYIHFESNSTHSDENSLENSESNDSTSERSFQNSHQNINTPKHQPENNTNFQKTTFENHSNQFHQDPSLLAPVREQLDHMKETLSLFLGGDIKPAPFGNRCWLYQAGWCPNENCNFRHDNSIYVAQYCISYFLFGKCSLVSHSRCHLRHNFDGIRQLIMRNTSNNQENRILLRLYSLWSAFTLLLQTNTENLSSLFFSSDRMPTNKQVFPPGSLHPLQPKKASVGPNTSGSHSGSHHSNPSSNPSNHRSYQGSSSFYGNGGYSGSNKQPNHQTHPMQSSHGIHPVHGMISTRQAQPAVQPIPPTQYFVQPRPDKNLSPQGFSSHHDSHHSSHQIHSRPDQQPNPIQSEYREYSTSPTYNPNVSPQSHTNPLYESSRRYPQHQYNPSFPTRSFLPASQHSGYSSQQIINDPGLTNHPTHPTHKTHQSISYESSSPSNNQHISFSDQNPQYLSSQRYYNSSSNYPPTNVSNRSNYSVHSPQMQSAPHMMTGHQQYGPPHHISNPGNPGNHGNHGNHGSKYPSSIQYHATSKQSYQNQQWQPETQSQYFPPQQNPSISFDHLPSSSPPPNYAYQRVVNQSSPPLPQRQFSNTNAVKYHQNYSDSLVPFPHGYSATSPVSNSSSNNNSSLSSTSSINLNHGSHGLTASRSVSSSSPNQSNQFYQALPQHGSLDEHTSMASLSPASLSQSSHPNHQSNRRNLNNSSNLSPHGIEKNKSGSPSQIAAHLSSSMDLLMNEDQGDHHNSPSSLAIPTPSYYSNQNTLSSRISPASSSSTGYLHSNPPSLSPSTIDTSTSSQFSSESPASYPLSPTIPHPFIQADSPYSIKNDAYSRYHRSSGHSISNSASYSTDNSNPNTIFQR